MRILSIISTIIILKNIESLMVVLNKNKSFCVNKDIDENDTLRYQYSVSGDSTTESSVNVTIMKRIIGKNTTKDKDKNSNIIYNNGLNEGVYKKEDSGSVQILNKSSITICFKSKYPEAIVSFEFYSNKESGHYLNVAQNEVFDDMFKNVTLIGLMYEEIENNLKFFIERREIHSNSKIILISYNWCFK